jgi:hypothetical protein
LLLFPLLAGCQLELFGRKRPVVGPAVLSRGADIERVAAVVNGGTERLRSWRCGETKVYLRAAGLPMPQRLVGSLACEAPGRFRLVAGNVVGVHADLGANEDRGWVYAKPGESVVLTWRHEDAWMLSEAMPGFPQLDPQWLMQLFGLSKLNPAEYEIETPADVRNEIWLAGERVTEGGVNRWVIQVDLQEGRIREQVLYGEAGEVLMRAELSDYQGEAGARLPHHLRLVFPATSTELTLTLGRIEINPQLSANLWRPPTGGATRLVDLRDLDRWARENPERARMTAARGGSSVVDADPVSEAGLMGEEPEFDTAMVPDMEAEPEFDVPVKKRSRWLWWGRE